MKLRAIGFRNTTGFFVTAKLRGRQFALTDSYKCKGNVLFDFDSAKLTFLLHERQMSKSRVVVFCVIFATETLLICIGNAFTIFVFWNQRSGSLRRTCYLLLNLAVVDLLVGLSEPISLATKTIPSLTGTASSLDDVNANGYILSTFLVAFSMMSIISLAFISLERAFAILRPFAHRATSTRVYLSGIAFVWGVGFCLAVIYILPTFGVWN